jgi:hypothetical protein
LEDEQGRFEAEKKEVYRMLEDRSKEISLLKHRIGEQDEMQR